MKDRVAEEFLTTEFISNFIDTLAILTPLEAKPGKEKELDLRQCQNAYGVLNGVRVPS